MYIPETFRLSTPLPAVDSRASEPPRCNCIPDRRHGCRSSPRAHLPSDKYRSNLHNNSLESGTSSFSPFTGNGCFSQIIFRKLMRSKGRTRISFLTSTAALEFFILRSSLFTPTTYHLCLKYLTKASCSTISFLLHSTVMPNCDWIFSR